MASKRLPRSWLYVAEREKSLSYCSFCSWRGEKRLGVERESLDASAVSRLNKGQTSEVLVGVERKETAFRRGFLYFSNSAMVALFGTIAPRSNRALLQPVARLYHSSNLRAKVLFNMIQCHPSIFVSRSVNV